MLIDELADDLTDEFIVRLREAARPDEYFALTIGERFKGDGFGNPGVKEPDFYVTKWSYRPTLDDNQCIAHGPDLDKVVEQFETWIAARDKEGEAR